MVVSQRESKAFACGGGVECFVGQSFSSEAGGFDDGLILDVEVQMAEGEIEVPFIIREREAAAL